MSFRGGLYGKLAAWGLMLAVVGLIVTQLLLPIVQSLSDLQSDLLKKEELAAKFAAENLRLEAALSALEGSESPESGQEILLASTDGNLAGTELRDYFAEALAASGGVAQSTQNLVSQTEGGLEATALRVTMTATLEQFHQLLHRLESRRPLLFVDGLNIQAVRNAPSAPAVDAPLRIQLNVIGYFLPAVSS